MKSYSAILMLFIDGLGIGTNDPAVNPIYAGNSPAIAKLMEKSTPIDASLGIRGLPQSATGQTTLFTGINAPRIMGSHIEGFPGQALRKIIEEKNIFRQLSEIGKKSTFANAYFTTDIQEIKERSLKSVTTVAALSAFGTVRGLDMLESGKAVYHDITREYLISQGYKGDIITPEKAADDLLSITLEHDFTLFEFFQTDRAGHTADINAALRVLAKLDSFISAIMNHVLNSEINVIIVSDHGNIEDISTTKHTSNKVPFIAIGKFFEKNKMNVSSLIDVTPEIIRTLTHNK